MKDRITFRLKADVRPLYLQLVEALFSWIEQEGLRPGDPVPGEPELARIFQVGRSTVREAMVYLEYEGIVNRSQGQRTTLTSLVRQAVLGLEVLEPVEALAERQGWQCQTAELSLVQERATERQASKLGVSPGDLVTLVRRTKLIDGRPFVLMESVVPGHILPYERFRKRFKASITELLYEEAALRFATTEITAVAASEDLARKLELPDGAPVLLVEEVFFGDGEAALAWNLNYFVPGIIHVELLRKTPIRKAVNR